jgi:rod shape-determining protein MreB
MSGEGRRPIIPVVLNSIFHWFSKDLGIDLGTANTLIYVKGEGIVCNEPSVVAVRKDARAGRRILAIGAEAKRCSAVRPARSSRFVRSRTASSLTSRSPKACCATSFRRFTTAVISSARVSAICAPSGITAVEKRALREAAESAGAREVYLIEEPMAAAIGAGLPITEPSGNMIVDIGGGTTEVAVISLAGVVFSRSVRVAGDKMDEAIAEHIKRKYNVLIGERTAELIKIMEWSSIDGYIAQQRQFIESPARPSRPP